MQDQTQRLPTPRATLPDFAPVPRKCPRHDGWTPERQRAFVAALADTGCVAIAARMVNMSPESAYMLRRAPGAESFRKAWEAAQGLGLQVVKDEAFHRAMHGQLVPVFVAGKLIGFRRKKNDRLLMFILRHYGQDASGRRTTINYFSTKATAGAAANPPRNGEGDHAQHGGGVESPTLTAAEAATTTVKTVITGTPGPSEARPGGGEAARLLESFAGVALDAQAKADIYRALEQAAERRRALEADPAEDPELWYVGADEAGPYVGELEIGDAPEEIAHRPDGEHRWESLGEGGHAAEIDRVVEEMQARLASEGTCPEPVEGPEARTAHVAAARAATAASIEHRTNALPAPVPDGVEADDPQLDWRNWKTGEYVPPLPPLPLAEGHQGVGKAEGEEAVLSPRPIKNEGPAPAKAGSKPRKPYRKRRPKPPFTAPDEAAEARARQEVAAQRREAAKAEATRRERRKA
ncbi:MAG: hypothetical protein KF780_05085 [Sphingomonas sp.]|nr:hypothetical protein [Sphingomonas sp.]